LSAPTANRTEAAAAAAANDVGALLAARELLRLRVLFKHLWRARELFAPVFSRASCRRRRRRSYTHARVHINIQGDLGKTFVCLVLFSLLTNGL